MKLLSKEELKGIDSTQSTITKWDEFFREALPRLGYKDSLLNEMYPYEAGIPMRDGSTLPVMDTGRVFYQLSWAEKLAGVLSVFHSGLVTTHATVKCIYYTLVGLWAHSLTTFQNFFPDETEERYNQLREQINLHGLNGFAIPSYRDAYNSRLAQELWARFLNDSDVYVDGSSSGLLRASNATGLVSDHYKQLLSTFRTDFFVDASIHTHSVEGYVLFFFNKNLENVFTDFPKETVRALVAEMSSTAAEKLRNYDEVYLQDYLVVSLNPIDKFMCSTKQAFQSCMSISKQNDVTGTSSIHAFGLPALFRSESVFLVFTTPGKHKNMYWETEELKKDPSERDKEKAYKYLKMTCRALTYKGYIYNEQRKFIKDLLPNKLWEDVKAYRDLTENEIASQEKIADICARLQPDQPRLYIGRQYAARGEDRVWTVLAEIMLARQGVSTSYAYATEVEEYARWMRSEDKSAIVPRYMVTEDIYEGKKNYLLRFGNLCDNKAITYDKYGYIRGIYYDNVTWNFIPNARSMNGFDLVKNMCKEQREELKNIIVDGIIETPVEKEGHVIRVGNQRTGSSSVSMANPKRELDMFLVMLGKQDYSFINQNVKICYHCGKLISGSQKQLADGSYICDDCCEKLQIKTCAACGKLYIESDAHLHELYNIRELTNPKNYQELPPKYVCTSQLKECEPNKTRDQKYVCAHCGDIVSRYDVSYYHSLSNTINHTFKDHTIMVRVCSKCLGKAVMCDKCKRLIFLDTLADACLLLPNRRVVCPDCIDNIRMKQEKRKKLKDLLQEAETGDFTPEPDPDITVADTIARNAEQEKKKVGKVETLIKDVHKQIKTYLQTHPEEAFPVLKSSNTPFPESSTEVEDTETVSNTLL